MPSNNLYLTHHGIKGQRWGVRRYQNPDGTLTEDGKKKYAKSIVKEYKTAQADYNKDKDIMSKIHKHHDTLDKSVKLFEGKEDSYRTAERLVNKYDLSNYDVVMKISENMFNSGLHNKKVSDFTDEDWQLLCKK